MHLPLSIVAWIPLLHFSTPESTLRYESKARKPNILFMVADDLGFNDVGWNNPEIPTPNLEELRENNTIILDNYYVQYVCTPSRAAFMTGMYPYHLGLQHYVIAPNQPNFLPGNVRLLPEYLKDLNYTTHAIGKWHLGFCRWDKTPTYRGFDTFYGFYTGENDYFKHAWAPHGVTVGLDFRDGKNVVRDQNGTYSVFSFTKRAEEIIENSQEPFYMYLAYQNIHEPLQVPEAYLDANIVNDDRRFTTAMVKIMDESIGNLTESLKKSGRFEDTIIIFTTDNGGRVDGGGNNWPLRGSKLTIWEGGTKGVGFIKYNGFVKSYSHEGLFHVVDWLPTLVEAAGGRSEKLDGVSQWKQLLSSSGTSARNEFLYNIDEIDNMAALRIGNYKLIVGTTGIHNGWYPPPNPLTSSEGHQALKTADEFGDLVMMTTTNGKILLFDLEKDPYERVDISGQNPDIVDMMMKRLEWYNSTRVPVRFPAETERADPKYFNNTWSPGWC